MGEVLEIRTPDQLELPPPDRIPPPGRWRTAAGVALLIVLASAGGYAITRPASTATSHTPESTASAPTVSTSPPPLEPDDPALVAVRDALAAWSEFSRTGSLSSVATSFEEEGPQMRRFRDEAGALTAAPSAGFTPTLRTSAVRIGSTPRERLVDASLELARRGQSSEPARWQFVVREGADGLWRVWTVKTELAAEGSQ